MKQVVVECPCCEGEHLLTPKRTVRGQAKKRRPSHSVKAKDEAWAKAVKEKGMCLVCGSRDNLQAAHIFTRSLRATRWDLENGVCLCLGCHLFWAHRHPYDFLEWVKSWMGNERFEALQQRANKTVKSVRKVS